MLIRHLLRAGQEAETSKKRRWAEKAAFRGASPGSSPDARPAGAVSSSTSLTRALYPYMPRPVVSKQQRVHPYSGCQRRAAARRAWTFSFIQDVQTALRPICAVDDALAVPIKVPSAARTQIRTPETHAAPGAGMLLVAEFLNLPIPVTVDTDTFGTLSVKSDDSSAFCDDWIRPAPCIHLPDLSARAGLKCVLRLCMAARAQGCAWARCAHHSPLWTNQNSAEALCGAATQKLVVQLSP